MNQRKRAFNQGLSKIRKTNRASRSTKNAPSLLKITPKLYNRAGMLETNQIIHGDCIEQLNAGEPEQVDLVFADPPFNIGYLYHGYDDQKNVAEYVSWSEKWMRAVHRALKPNGSFYLAIGDEFAADLCHVARRTIGFNMRNWIIWHYTFGQQTKRMFAKSHTHILYFTKNKEGFTFNADDVRVASARQTTYGDKRANSKGKLPDDTWFLRPQEAQAADVGMFEPQSDVWNEARVCGTFKEREGWHGCQMPMGVLNRIIKASSNPGDIVLDPFSGSGTTSVAAHLLGRQYVGIDQSAEYVEHARKRLNQATEAIKQTNGTSPVSIEVLIDPNRASKVKTATDAFGRPRVERRRRAAKSA